MGKNKKATVTSTETTTTESSNEEMAATLRASGEKAEKQKAERRERVVKGAHLLGSLREAAEAANLKIEEKSGFLKITGAAKHRTVYVARKGGRVDLSGFTVEAPAVKQISEQEARDKHLGKVRGQLDFEQSDEAVLEAYNAGLARLAESTESK